MATPCLSRLLLIFLLGAIHVVAHPMNKDKPADSGYAVVQESPIVEWKAKEESHKPKHRHHGSQEPAVTYERITVKLDDKDVSKHKSDADGDEESAEKITVKLDEKDVSKHKSDADGDEESAETEDPSEASSKHDETTDTAHDEKRVKINDGDDELTGEAKEINEMRKLARKYRSLNRKERMRLVTLAKKYQHLIEEQELLDKSKNARPWWALKTDKSNEAIHRRNELAPTGERGLETKRKIQKRCDRDPVPWWIRAIINAVKGKKAKNREKKKAKEEEERRQQEAAQRQAMEDRLKEAILEKKKNSLDSGQKTWKEKEDLSKAISKNAEDSLDSKQKTKEEKEEAWPDVQLRDTPKPSSEDKTSKGFNKKPSEEKGTQKNKGSGLNDNKPNSSALQQKKDKEDKQKSEVQPNTASKHSKDGHLNQRRNSHKDRLNRVRRIEKASHDSTEAIQTPRQGQEQRIRKAASEIAESMYSSQRRKGGNTSRGRAGLKANI
ncbi:hypothetical protein FPCIR_2701 [Fusarium pseudocircinatum]|uniref:Uncharacterized protein n=1 Tax=Fusarium pseudocircinatum TaxID=56676 RepID=A0A8H5PMC3_9HYPO|nr:hypothetical protein FPCIR_2701 [Fusarium pseudocircinatum]